MSNNCISIIAGAIGSDPELKTFENGNSAINFMIPVTYWRKDRGERTVFWNVSYVGKNAIDLMEKLKKGTVVSVPVQEQTYNDVKAEKQGRYAIALSRPTIFDKKEAAKDDIPF